MTLRVALPDMVSPSYFPAIAAVELGFFAREGLDAAVELVYPVTRTVELLRDGDVDYVAGSAHAPLYLAGGWDSCQLLCALSQHTYWFLVVRSDLGAARGDLDALRGLRIGAAPGPDGGLRCMLRAAGMDPERDLTIGPVPGTTQAGVSFGVAAAQALGSGAVDGFWANGMGAEVAVTSGTGTLLVDARRGDGPPGTADLTFPALVAARARVDGDPDAAAAAVRAVVAAQRALAADPSLAVQAAAAHFPERERGLIAELVRRDAPFYDPAITPGKVEALHRFARDLDLPGAGAGWGYEDAVATRLAPLWQAD